MWRWGMDTFARSTVAAGRWRRSPASATRPRTVPWMDEFQDSQERHTSYAELIPQVGAFELVVFHCLAPHEEACWTGANGRSEPERLQGLLAGAGVEFGQLLHVRRP